MTRRRFRFIGTAIALALSVLLPVTFLSPPAQAQDIVRIVNVFTGTQSASISVVLEYPENEDRPAIVDGKVPVSSLPDFQVRTCDNCPWGQVQYGGRTEVSAKYPYGEPKQLQVTVPLPALCASTSYSMAIAVGGEPQGDAGIWGFGFTSNDGATIGTISGSVDGTTADVVVSVNTDDASTKTVYLRYRVHGSDGAWSATNGRGQEEVTFNLTGLTDNNYYELEASMGSDFKSCAVRSAFATIGTPAETVARPDALPTTADDFYAMPVVDTTTDLNNNNDNDSDNSGNTGGFGGFGGGGEPINLSPQFRQSATEVRLVAENSLEGQTVGKPIMAWDPENDALTFSLRGDDAELFKMEAIDDYSAQIVVGPEVVLDYEVRNVYSVELVVEDTAGKAAVSRLEIRLKDVVLPGVANDYDLANNHNELVERSEIDAAQADYDVGIITKLEMVGVTRLYYTHSFPAIDFGGLPLMVNKYDLNRDRLIDRGEVLMALLDFFHGRISKADMQEVVKIFFTGAETVTEEPEQDVEPLTEPAQS